MFKVGDSVSLTSVCFDLVNCACVVVGRGRQKSDPTTTIYLVQDGPYCYTALEDELKGVQHEKGQAT